MINVKKTENGVMGFGTIETKEDVEKLIESLAEILVCAEEEPEPEVEPAPHDDLLDALMDALGWGDDDEEECDECECEDDDADEEEWDALDGLLRVVTVGYTHDCEEVVIMNDRDSKWGLAEALLRAAARTWPVEVKQDEKLKDALLELAGVAHEHVDPDD